MVRAFSDAPVGGGALERILDVARRGPSAGYSQGVEFVRLTPPDVILLDLQLPDGSGLAIYESIRAIDARIPVIFVTVAKTADSAIDAEPVTAGGVHRFFENNPHHEHDE